mmetsp:Transcript_73151/g.148059  ORF Transcript_73151/g.148059 Transcript_73151/m.148059 type:complete len:210 (+) Transcript_73151:352-981(+)
MLPLCQTSCRGLRCPSGSFDQSKWLDAFRRPSSGHCSQQKGSTHCAQPIQRLRIDHLPAESERRSTPGGRSNETAPARYERRNHRRQHHCYPQSAAAFLLAKPGTAGRRCLWRPRALQGYREGAKHWPFGTSRAIPHAVGAAVPRLRFSVCTAPWEAIAICSRSRRSPPHGGSRTVRTQCFAGRPGPAALTRRFRLRTLRRNCCENQSV